MSECLARHELFEYNAKMPFLIYSIVGSADTGEKLLNHWHEELELAFYVKGGGRHYINGECVVAKQGRLVVTNSGFVHNIIPDESVLNDDGVCAIVIIIHPKFIESIFPEYEHFYFTNKKEIANDEMKELILDIAGCKGEESPFGHIYIKSQITRLLYLMCKEDIVERSAVDDINLLKNIERIKGVIQYVENNYKENITQSMIARKFYFSSVYFSRYFKNCTGMTFTDYLTSYRIEKARMELVKTDKTVTQIALETGFSDDRRLIIAFKKKHGITPLQYRKKQKNSV
ncbi:MAG: AraC family transcriptional regulator [Lachnospiraceae bacterium]|nr:AraC family transcriptional regulator [Lachnospiraceae bacterium]